jgi:magnesium transporter
MEKISRRERYGTISFLTLISSVLESIPPEYRKDLWQQLDPESGGEVLLEANEEVRAQLIRESASDRLAAAVARLDMDKLADLYDEIPIAVIDAVVQAMHVQRRKTLETLRAFPEDTAGGLMDLDAITVRSDITLEVVQRYLRWLRRKQGELPEATDTLMVVDLAGRYEGLLSLADVVSLDQQRTVASAMRRELEGIPATMPARKVAQLFQDRDLVSAPVVDEDGRLLGRITVDDMVDVIRDEADHAVLAPAGLDEEIDMFAPVLASARRRAVWLGVNLINAFVAAWVIGHFGGSIQQMVALAVLMPVVASMGGVAGNQTLTLVTRGIALDQVGAANAWDLLLKEVGVALVNGTFWALVVGAVAVAWFQSAPLGVVFGAAIIINLLNGAVVGALIPLGLTQIGIDPALAGGVLLTALTDVVGFASFLALATVFIL